MFGVLEMMYLIYCKKSNYMMLFSTTEGLPITLIEASMCGCPIICNDVGGNLEIAHDGENAFIANSWNELVCVLNSLLDIPKDDYMAMCAKSEKFIFHGLHLICLNKNI